MTRKADLNQRLERRRKQVEKQAERERKAGLDPDDAAAKWIRQVEKRLERDRRKQEEGR